MGIEVSRSLGDDATWDCWLRRDTAGRYSRFIHIRRVKMQSDVIVLIEALTGQTWDPSNKLYGSMYTPAGAGRNSRRARTPRPASYGHTQEGRARTGRYGRAGASGTHGRSREAGRGALVVQFGRIVCHRPLYGSWPVDQNSRSGALQIADPRVLPALLQSGEPQAQRIHHRDYREPDGVYDPEIVAVAGGEFAAD